MLLTVRLGRQRQVSSSRLQPADRQVGLCPAVFVQHAGVDGGAWNTQHAALFTHLREHLSICPSITSPLSLNQVILLMRGELFHLEILI